MKNLLLFLVSLAILIGLFGWETAAENPSLKSGEPQADIHAVVDGDSIFSFDNKYFFGTIFFDENAGEHVVAVDATGPGAHLRSHHGRGYSFDSLAVVKNHLYLYFSKGDKIFAEDVNLGSSDWVNSDLKFGYAETHSCDASCRSSYVKKSTCESCSFDRVDGKIVGCNCDSSYQTCCHTITAYPIGRR